MIDLSGHRNKAFIPHPCGRAEHDVSNSSGCWEGGGSEGGLDLEDEQRLLNVVWDDLAK